MYFMWCTEARQVVVMISLPHDTDCLGPESRLVSPGGSITKRGVTGVDNLSAARAQTQNTGVMRELYTVLWNWPPPPAPRPNLRWNHIIKEINLGGHEEGEERGGYLKPVQWPIWIWVCK